MPTWLAIAFTSFGLLFFAGHLAWAVSGVRRAGSRDERLEAAGASVPGFAGLLMGTAVWLPWPLPGLALTIIGLPILVLGRAVFELVVFHQQVQSSEPPRS